MKRDVLGCVIDHMDNEEQLMLTQTLELMGKAGSQAWTTRRLLEFGEWYRAKKALQNAEGGVA